MNASNTPAGDSATIDAREAGHFGALADDWWDPKGRSAMLHRLNPARLGHVRQAIDHHWHRAAAQRRPLDGLFALDVGCGGGLLTEPLARLGATTTGIDAAPPAIAVAQAHAAAMGLEIDYRSGEVAALLAEPARFDLITAMEVVEHVADVPAFLAALAALLKPDGLLILSTPNRTPQSRVLMVGMAERLGLVPAGTHDWSKFLTPDEMTQALAAAGLAVTGTTGLSFSPSRGFVLGDDVSLNYLMTVVRAG
jgi:2-polyprenyl-6-hydroxyphenyl methylase/3-demethylubiquinone-9 3-methyltransferase